MGDAGVLPLDTTLSPASPVPARRRLKPGQERHPCGCVSDSAAWVEQCEAHRAETTEIRTRWAAELRARRELQATEAT